MVEQYTKHSLLVLQILPFVDYVISREKKYQALPAFLYCKRRKAGWALGTRLGQAFAWKQKRYGSLMPRPHLLMRKWVW